MVHWTLVRDPAPPKISFWLGLERILKMQGILGLKRDGFSVSRTTFGVILFAYNILSTFSEKVEKINGKRDPKVMFFCPLASPGHPGVD